MSGQAGIQSLASMFRSRLTRFNTAERRFFCTGFNLLPYRAEQARRRKRRYSGELICAAVVGIAVASGIEQSAAREIMRAAQRQKALEQKLAALQPVLAQHKQEAARVQALAALQAQRSVLAELLAALAHAGAPEVRLMELNYEAGAGLLSGIASSPNALSHWLHALQRVPRLSSVELSHVQRHTGADAAKLTFRARFKWDQATRISTNRAVTAAHSLSQQGQR